MENIKLFDSELRLMEIIWAQAPISAKDVSSIAAEKFGWNKNTTYTVIKKLINKEAVERSEPGFICTPLITKEKVQLQETKTLIDKVYNGSVKLLFSTFLKSEKLSVQELDEIRRIIDSQK